MSSNNIGSSWPKIIQFQSIQLSSSQSIRRNVLLRLSRSRYRSTLVIQKIIRMEISSLHPPFTEVHSMVPYQSYLGRRKSAIEATQKAMDFRRNLATGDRASFIFD